MTSVVYRKSNKVTKVTSKYGYPNFANWLFSGRSGSGNWAKPPLIFMVDGKKIEGFPPRQRFAPILILSTGVAAPTRRANRPGTPKAIHNRPKRSAW
jgi:hypothetical protein